MSKDHDVFLNSFLKGLVYSEQKIINDNIDKFKSVSENIENLKCINKIILSETKKKELFSYLENHAKKIYKVNKKFTLMAKFIPEKEDENYEYKVNKLIENVQVSGEKEDCQRLMIYLFDQTFENVKNINHHIATIIDKSINSRDLYIVTKNILLEKDLERIKNVKYLKSCDRDGSTQLFMDDEMRIFLFQCTLYMLRNNEEVNMEKSGRTKEQIDENINKLNFKFFVNRAIVDKEFIDLTSFDSGQQALRKNFSF